jgi:hypothetical protein
VSCRVSLQNYGRILCHTPLRFTLGDAMAAWRPTVRTVQSCLPTVTHGVPASQGMGGRTTRSDAGDGCSMASAGMGTGTVQLGVA